VLVMQLLDQYGRPMKRPARRDLEEELAAPSMGTVRSIHTGHPAEGLTPQRLASILKQAETGDPTSYLELAEQMEEKDLHYAAVLGVRKRAVRALELQVEPAGNSAAEEDAAALVREVLDTAAMRLVLIDLLDSLGKGYSVAEIVWDTQGRKWVPKRIVHRDPRHFRPDLDTGQRLLLRSNAGEVELPPFKFVTHFATAKSGLPIRAGLARLAGWAYIFKNYSIRDWAIFMEAYGHPIRLGKYGPTATEADRATLLRAVRRIGTDLAAIVPHSMEVELVNGNVTGAGALYVDSARYWD
jgi:phage gp29-like protein